MNKLLVAIFVLFLVATVFASHKDSEDVQKWRKKFNKQWKTKNSASIERRSSNIKKRKERIAAHNADPEATYTLGSNEFDDLDSDEFVSRLCGTKVESKPYEPPPTFRNKPAQPKFNSYTATTVPAALNWAGYCLPVVNQGRCGSCWAFAALSQLECYNRMRFGSTWNNQLAPQYLLECDTTNGNCGGGWPRKTFDYLKTAGISVPLWVNYPYTSANYFKNSTYSYTGLGACKSYVSRVAVNFNNVYQLNANGDETAFKVQVANYGPQVAAIYVSANFQNYKSGVFYDTACTATGIANCASVNHAVLVTGYGTLNGQDYWIVKNSWGSTWGNAGYIWMARNRANNCNTACYAMCVD